MSTHQRGSQDISHHHDTYRLVMDITIWSGGLLGVTILFTSMVFGAGVAWFPSLIITLLGVVVAGMVLKRGSAWHATYTCLAIFTFILSLIISFIAGLG